MPTEPPPAPKMSPDEAFARANDAHRAGRLGEAERLSRSLLSIAPGHPDVLHLLGVICGQQGRNAEAIELIGRAAAQMPRVPAFHFNLGNVYIQARRWDDAARAFGEAWSLDPHNVDAGLRLGLCCAKMERFDEAIRALRGVLAASPDNVHALAELSACLGRTGEVGEAVVLQERALRLAPDNAGFWANLGFLRLRQRRWPEAVEAFDAALDRVPWHVPALAGKGVALFEDGRDAEAHQLVDLDGLIDIRQLELRPDIDQGALAEALAHHESSDWGRSDTTTRHGAQTGDLLGDAHPSIAALVAALVRQVDSVVRAKSPDPGHPFLARIPAGWTFSIWATILDRDGHQTAHLHPAGWLSGVCYIDVPDRVLSADNIAQEGWIEFGAPGYGVTPVRSPVTRRIRPEPGTLVLFPSYFFHRTIPLAGAARRISVAFDLIPSSWRS